MQRLSSILVLTLVTLLGGCRGLKDEVPLPPPACYDVYLDPALPALNVRRVLVMPLENWTGDPVIAAALHAELIAELQKTGRFEVVLPDPTAFAPADYCIGEPGRFSEPVLVQAVHQHQCDAVLFGRITVYEPYRPMRLGAVVHLVSTHEAIPLATVDGVWEAPAEEVPLPKKLARKARKLPPPPALEPTLVIHSPRHLQRQVAGEIAFALSQW